MDHRYASQLLEFEPFLKMVPTPLSVRGVMLSASGSNTSTSTGTGRKPRLLIADDERVIADTLAIIFRKAGYETQAVYSGEAILEVLESFEPDLVLTDVMMPGMTGVEAAVAIRQLRPNCKVLLLSGQADTEDLLKDSRTQGFEFELVGKPVDPKALIAKVKQISWAN